MQTTKLNMSYSRHGMMYFLVLILVTTTTQAIAQSFSCSWGQPACLDYGDKVCSSNAMCVDQMATCFDYGTCDYRGYACVSQVDECVDTYEDLLRDHNQLVREYNELLREHEQLTRDYNRLLNER